MTFKGIADYLQAGFDESLVKLVKGVFANMVVGGVLYLYHHLTTHGLTVLQVASVMGLGTPALMAGWHYLKTTAADASDTSEPVVTTDTANASGLA